MIGRTLSHYQIREKLGSGGMGDVYLAHDTKLNRDVAFKVLPPELAENEQRRARFKREAQAVAALNHPGIVQVHAIDEVNGMHFIVMELVRGEVLSRRILGSGMPWERFLELAVPLARAVGYAHRRGITHRDLKPDNVIVTEEGDLKVLDFGLAKLVEPLEVDSAGPTRSRHSITEEGVVLGSPSYMSPEQAEGGSVDARSDVFSLGIIFYEMLTGARPFDRSSNRAVRLAIATLEPTPLREANPSVPPQIAAVIDRCLRKDPGARYPNADELASALDSVRVSSSGSRRLLLPVGVVLILITLGAFLTVERRAARERWAREEALPQVSSYVARDEYWRAYEMGEEAARYISTDPVLADARKAYSAVVSIDSEPSGAVVRYKPYERPDAPWIDLGQTPIENVRLSRGFSRWAVELPRYQALESAFGFPYREDFHIRFRLDRANLVPPGMVRVEGGPVAPTVAGGAAFDEIELDDFWIDRFEVTNEEFQAFVDSGGYRDPRFWKQRFARNGAELPFEKALEVFVDQTGRAGPSTWELGRFPEGTEKHPVGGVSWYEAAAYAEYAGKTLPTVFHWYRAARLANAPTVVAWSNIEGRSQSSLPVGETKAVNATGAYDMAGNVREWIWNEAGSDSRYRLGGGWSDFTHQAVSVSETGSPWDRSPENGLRCMSNATETEPNPAARQRIDVRARDYSAEHPVDDELFEVYKRIYAYDDAPLDPMVEEVEEGNEHWVREKVSFAAPYADGDERITCYIFLPRKSSPPYQAVVFGPGSFVFQGVSFDSLPTFTYDYVVRSGRALVYPVYKGTFERHEVGISFRPAKTQQYREHVIAWVRDLRRSVDYVTTRDDIDMERLAYVGLSWGAAMLQLPALENRFRAVVLISGGLMTAETFPEVDPINFAPRLKAPTLMANGRYDSGYPLETSQKPLFQLLGAPASDKRHKLFESGHGPPANQLIREVLDWLDRYLGPVDSKLR